MYEYGVCEAVAYSLCVTSTELAPKVALPHWSATQIDGGFMTTPRGLNSGVEIERVRANLTGAYVTIAGVVLLVISVFLDWASSDQDDVTYKGYEADSLIPFSAYLGIGFAVALLYAGSRAYRRQHRGLSLASMAVGLAVTLFALSWLFDIPGAFGEQAGYGAEIGVYVGLVGAALWTIGSALLAKEPEGDPEHDRVHHANDRDNDRGTDGTRGPSGR